VQSLRFGFVHFHIFNVLRGDYMKIALGHLKNKYKQHTPNFKIIIMVIVLIQIACIFVGYKCYINEKNRKYIEAFKLFEAACEYVKRNQDSYTLISEYELSKLNFENSFFQISSVGKYQNERNIAFKYGHSVIAQIPKSKDGNGIVTYEDALNDMYNIVIVFKEDVVNQDKIYETETTVIINENIYVFIYYVNH